MGSPEFAVPCLRALAGAHEVALVVSQPDKPAGRGSQLTAPAVKVAAQGLGIPVIQPRSARTGELHDAMVATGAELAVVVAYGKILPAPVLDALPRGCINVHASILPRYRGAAPVQWAVIHGDRETAVDIMQHDVGMDTACLDAIAALAAGTAHPVAQDHAAATHAPMLTKADGAVDFAQPAHRVAARIRGVDPWPGAQALHRGQIVKLFRAVPQARPPGAEAAGTVIAIDAAGLHVACGEDVCVIREIQAPGRKRLAAAQFAAGRGIAVGDVLARPEPA